MNIGLCIAWFLFGAVVGAMTIISIAVISVDQKNKENEKNGKDKNLRK